MKIDGDVPSSVTHPLNGGQTGAQNDHRWLADLERAWLSHWPTEHPGSAGAASAPRPNNTPLDERPTPAAAQPVSTLPAATLVALSESPLSSTLTHAPQGLLTSPPLASAATAPAGAEPTPNKPDPTRTLRPASDDASEPSPHPTSARPLPPAPLEPAPTPSALRIAITESGAQATLRDAQLSPEAALVTGQAIAQQLRHTGLTAHRVYVNGIQIADDTAPHHTPPPDPVHQER